jgi:hypothetical protein
MGRFELDKYVNIAVGTEIGSQHRPEKGQATDMSLQAKFRKLLLINCYVRHESTLTTLRAKLHQHGKIALFFRELFPKCGKGHLYFLSMTLDGL